MVEFYIKNEVTHELPSNDLPKFYSFGVPTYTNLGDQAVSLAQKKYIEREFPEYQFIEILEDDNDEGIEIVKKAIRPGDIVSFVGGGNMGSLYTDHEEARRKVFSTFVDNLTISFPQSMHFEDNEHGKAEEKLSQAAYAKNSHLFLIARDAQSYHRMQTTFKNKVLFTPDMVLYMKPVKHEVERSSALIVLRHDSEKVVKQETVDGIKNMLSDNYSVDETDTVLDTVKRITPINREKLFKQELELFAKQEIIVTDRWHAMVFSVLTGTPCLLFGNSYGKGKHAYFDWLEHINWVSYTDEDDLERIQQQVNELMQVHTHEYDIKDDFNQLRHVIQLNSNKYGL
ncbi:polysaccharide pyruvyl transferase family protein [Liquorilactobacillus mali]|uniref:Exopolysaccharide biosynthesis protein n=1 Tax=Liquorilactobacillus mali KCTC 3596 = DSM 20444 TaxID=1046596 RepID=A0A0R2EE18_9LACO|nr:polysaccharide pyruvyl transferase family protein [Liquorilactobacillus mali]KRN11066.1 exopolysaccharide biosynthesis protein [Liquorilactobacillus mali KCTC 3596 = DSM 20444]